MSKRAIRLTITDPEFSPLFDSDTGMGFERSVQASVSWYLARLKDVERDVQQNRTRTLDWQTRLKWRKAFKKRVLNALKKYKVYHAILTVGRSVYLLHRYQDAHLSLYRIEPAVPSLEDIREEVI